MQFCCQLDFTSTPSKDCKNPWVSFTRIPFLWGFNWLLSIISRRFGRSCSTRSCVFSSHLHNYAEFGSNPTLQKSKLKYREIKQTDQEHDLVIERKVKVKVKSLSRVRLFATPWTVAYQAPQSVEFSRQEYWNGLPFPSPGDLPNPGIEPRSPALQADALLSEPPEGLVLKETEAQFFDQHIHSLVHSKSTVLF
ncbi:hypothetical protein MG293_001826 [Ovis ammon polii]|uniref:Uncharacterized protein n=1 Tax=Ovis ammon polii TaxID=230172 RepID=A0AAD4UQ62_OVIAM|nr:hypothetical protein MG293_001826 [Ovis ammon polii]